MDEQASINDILISLKEKKIEKVKVGVTDLDGVLRGKYIHIDKLEKSFLLHALGLLR